MEKRELEKKIRARQKSTASIISFFTPLHDRLRLKYFWYQKWHENRYSSSVHWLILIILLFVLFYILANLLWLKYESGFLVLFSSALKNLGKTWISIINDFVGR